MNCKFQRNQVKNEGLKLVTYGLFLTIKDRLDQIVFFLTHPRFYCCLGYSVCKFQEYLTENEGIVWVTNIYHSKPMGTYYDCCNKRNEAITLPKIIRPGPF